MSTDALDPIALAYLREIATMPMTAAELGAKFSVDKMAAGAALSRLVKARCTWASGGTVTWYATAAGLELLQAGEVATDGV